MSHNLIPSDEKEHMAKSASQAAGKWQQRTAGASQDYVDGAQNTPKDQAAAAIAAKSNYQAGLQASFSKDSYAKGLQRSGKQGWLAGVTEKGGTNFATGVASGSAHSKYATNSGKYDAARGSAANIPRGPRGSAANLQRVAAVAQAQNAVRVGK